MKFSNFHHRNDNKINFKHNILFKTIKWGTTLKINIPQKKYIENRIY